MSDVFRNITTKGSMQDDEGTKSKHVCSLQRILGKRKTKLQIVCV